MNGVNKTLYIPLYGKALVSNRDIILKDETAEYIWSQESFKLKEIYEGVILEGVVSRKVQIAPYIMDVLDK